MPRVVGDAMWSMTALEWQRALAQLPPSISVLAFDVDAINNETDHRALALRHEADVLLLPIPLKGWRVNEMLSQCPRGDARAVVQRIVEYVVVVVDGRRQLNPCGARPWTMAADLAAVGLSVDDLPPSVML